MADMTGGVDTSSYANPNNRLLAAASNDPSTFLSNANSAVALQRQGVSLTQQQFQLGQQRLGQLNGLLGSIVTNPTAANVGARITDAVRLGVIDEPTAQQQMVQVAQMGGDPNQIKQWAYDHLSQNATHEQSLNEAYGAPATVNTGGAIQPVLQKTGPDAGTYAGGGAPIPTTLTPADKTGRIDSINPTTGAKQSQSVGQLYDSQGNFISAPQGVGPAAGTTAPPAPVTFGGARSAAGVPVQTDAQGNSLDPATGKPVTLPANTPVQPASPLSGALTTGLSPGADTSFKNSAGAWQNLASDAGSPSGVNQRVFMLDQALGALRNTNTGLGTTARQHIQSYLAALPGGVGKWAAGDPTKLSDFDLANKYLTAYSLNTPGAARSDAGLNSAGAANASVNINPQAAQEVTLSNIGLERMKQAQANAFINSGQDPGTFSNWAAKWGQNVDPKAFALGSMTPAERTQVFNGLSGKALDSFRQSVRKGLASGVLSQSDLQGSAANGQQ